MKVVDFGLAKLSEDAAASWRSPPRSAATEPGVVLGSVWYMSPEQARGEKVDGRTDVWSLGAVLYELLAGRPPFTGRTANDVLTAIVEQEPAPLSPRHVPPAVERIVTRALQKDRDAR